MMTEVPMAPFRDLVAFAHGRELEVVIRERLGGREL